MAFYPTFHRYRLNDYIGKKGRNVFVCSMADLFGDWVPNNWIEEVFAACENAPQHNYLFLTKSPRGIPKSSYIYSNVFGSHRDNYWFGTTITCQSDLESRLWTLLQVRGHTFLSIDTLFFTVIFAVGIINGEIELEQLMNEKMLSNLLFAIIFLIIMVNVCLHTDSVCFSRTVGLISGNILGYIILYLHESRLFLASDNEIAIIQVIGYYSFLLIMIRLIKWLLKYMIKRQRGEIIHVFYSIEDVVYDITFDRKDDKKYYISDLKEVGHAKEAKENPPAELEDIVSL